MRDKYGTGQDPYCYPDSDVLRNRLGILDPELLEQAEREISALEAQLIEFHEPPYDLAYWQSLHRQLFGELYDWAGQIRVIDISKQQTRFCTVARIEPEAGKIFAAFARQNYWQGLSRHDLVRAAAEAYAELNMIHPFREGNGRAQRVLFEHLIVNCGYAISWDAIGRDEWLNANIAGVYCNYLPMIALFERCIGTELEE